MNYWEMTPDERIAWIAHEYHIEGKIAKLKEDLLKVPGVVDVEFDLDGFFDNFNQVIFLTKYDIPVQADDYYKQRKKLIVDVLRVALDHGLSWSGDTIEDYGEHFYFVTEFKGKWQD